jgi:BirA family biotin operon repressor/biotin-[acetyl-CoA-carboxylase] ligase
MSPALGRPRLHLRSTGSTNDRARELAAAGAPHGTLVTAGEQTAGRGRQGRSWSAPPGQALLMSLLLREHKPLLPLVAAVAVADVVAGTLGDAAVAIKWPNDVLADGRKVAGILVEGRPQEGWAVVGVGLNVAVRVEDLPAELRDRAGSMKRASDQVETVLARLLERLAIRVAQPDDELLAAWRTRDALMGQAVEWADGSGVAAGVDGEGRLLVETPAGDRVTLGAGEVHLTGQG